MGTPMHTHADGTRHHDHHDSRWHDGHARTGGSQRGEPHGAGGPPVLDIGGDIGAMVVLMDPVTAGSELHLRSEHEPPIAVHTGVWTRPHGSDDGHRGRLPRAGGRPLLGARRRRPRRASGRDRGWRAHRDRPRARPSGGGHDADRLNACRRRRSGTGDTNAAPTRPGSPSCRAMPRCGVTAAVRSTIREPPSRASAAPVAVAMAAVSTVTCRS